MYLRLWVGFALVFCALGCDVEVAPESTEDSGSDFRSERDGSLSDVLDAGETDQGLSSPDAMDAPDAPRIPLVDPPPAPSYSQASCPQLPQANSVDDLVMRIFFSS